MSNSRKPKFDKFFKEIWNYDEDDGVGLKLVGKPNNIDKFIEILEENSCNPVAARRVLTELMKNGEKYTTLMFQLNFNSIGEALKEVGVDMIIVPPIQLDKTNNVENDMIAFDIVSNGLNVNNIKFKNENQKIEILKKANEFYANKTLSENNYGCFNKNRKSIFSKN